MLRDRNYPFALCLEVCACLLYSFKFCIHRQHVSDHFHNCVSMQTCFWVPVTAIESVDRSKNKQTSTTSNFQHNVHFPMSVSSRHRQQIITYLFFCLLCHRHFPFLSLSLCLSLPNHLSLSSSSTSPFLLSL